MKQPENRSGRIAAWLRENRQVWWVLAVPLILVMYYLPEQVVSTTDYWNTALPLDDLIPFVPQFVWFYVAWFALLAATGLWLLLRDAEGFRRYMQYLTLAYFLSMIFYLLVPNGQDLRPELPAQGGGLSVAIIRRLYQMDTNTNVLPSLHVIASLGVAFAVTGSKTVTCRPIRAGAVALAVIISASTLFVKQHAVLDVITGLLVGVALHLFTGWVFRRRAAKRAARNRE